MTSFDLEGIEDTRNSISIAIITIVCLGAIVVLLGIMNGLEGMGLEYLWPVVAVLLLMQLVIGRKEISMRQISLSCGVLWKVIMGLDLPFSRV